MGLEGSAGRESIRKRGGEGVGSTGRHGKRGGGREIPEAIGVYNDT